MQFDGQTHVLSVDLVSSTPGLAELEEGFLAAYEARFHVSLPGMRAVLVNLHTSVIGKRPALPIAALIAHRRAGSVQAALIGERPVWFDGGWHNTPVYDRDAIPLGASLAGPAILNQLDTTVVIEPKQAVRVDACGNVLIEIVEHASAPAISLTKEPVA
jgi:N-methylhydantoinase A